MKRLLIIEDETSIRENYCELFEEEGYIVTGASSGKEGIELAVVFCPDLIICDIGMPGMDGFEVKDTLSKDKRTSTIPFIYLTARTDIKDVQRAMELGADDFIIKPVSTSKLLELVSNRLQRIEESTRQSEARLNRAELISKSGNWELHIESRIIILSKGANKIYGVPNYSVDFETIINVILPEYHKQIETGFKLLIENNQPFNIEYKIKAADTGEIKVIHSVAEYDEERKVILGAIQDITERKIAEDALLQSETRYRQLVDSAPLPVIIASLETGDFLYWNKNAANILGLNLDNQNNHNYKTADFYVYPKREQIVELIKKNGYISDFEVEIKNLNGRHFTILSSTLITVFENMPASFITFFDITERKLSEEKLTKYSEELKESYAAKKKLLTIIAHDLRGPFSPILGLSQTIVNEFDSLKPGELKLYNTEIFNSMKSAYTLFENLLNWSKLETGVMKLNPSKINLFNHTEEAVNLITGNARLKNILLVNTVEQNTYVTGDSDMIHSILQNLISNAIKFTHKSGMIKIRSEKTDNKFIRVTVSDSGVGMTEEQTKNLFSAAVKSTNGTYDEKGTGLGLMICKEMIERHGGSISVKSEFGKGTDIIFTLPGIE